jgi:hypothetical protein
VIRSLVRALLALVLLLIATAGLQAQSVTVTPPGAISGIAAHTTGFVAAFTVTNNDDTDDFTFSCGKIGDLVCQGTSISSATIGINQSIQVQVYYTSGAVSGTGTIRLSVTHVSSGSKFTGGASVTMGAARITFRAPSVAVGGTVEVHTRRPVLLAEYNPMGAVDTTATVVKWRGNVVTSQAQRSAHLAEWEVDSATQLAIGDSVAFEVTFCTPAARR